MKLWKIVGGLAAGLLIASVRPAFATPDLTFDPQPLDLGIVQGGTWPGARFQVTNNHSNYTWVFGDFLNLWQQNYQVLPGTDATALKFLNWGDVVVDVKTEGYSPYAVFLAPGESAWLDVR